MRTLQDGSVVDELDKPKILTITTKCPAKWILIDKETGETYTTHTTEGKYQWKKIDNARY